MLPFSDTALSAGVTVPRPTAQGPLFVDSQVYTRVLFSPTAMDLTPGGSTAAPAQVAGRTATTCFMRGYAERVRYQTSTSLPWFWRRICFRSKSEVFRTTATNDSPTRPWAPYVETSLGFNRLMMNMARNNMDNTLNNIEGILFKGSNGQDWTDLVIAPVDTARVDLAYDKTFTLKSGNERGTVGEKKFWFGMNKNLIYSDDETGVQEDTSYFSVTDKKGMGDYYIYDIFSAGTGATTADVLVVAPSSSLYWHEK